MVVRLAETVYNLLRCNIVNKRKRTTHNCNLSFGFFSNSFSSSLRLARALNSGDMQAQSENGNGKTGTSNRTPDDWKQRWTENQIAWHEQSGNSLLWSQFESIVKKSFPMKEAKDLKIFVPLCGKAKDMYMFYELGFTVVGVEYASQAIREFFDENSVKVKQREEGSVFTESVDGRLIIGEGDLFSFTTAAGDKMLPLSKYDIIWDRGSFVALNVSERVKYCEYITSLLDKEGVHLIEIHEYNTDEYQGPPMMVTQEDLVKLFGHELKVKLIISRDGMADDATDREKWISRGLSVMKICLYLMSRI